MSQGCSECLSLAGAPTVLFPHVAGDWQVALCDDLEGTRLAGDEIVLWPVVAWLLSQWLWGSQKGLVPQPSSPCSQHLLPGQELGVGEGEVFSSIPLMIVKKLVQVKGMS